MYDVVHTSPFEISNSVVLLYTVDLPICKQQFVNAFNVIRIDADGPVSYTHLDVYKRQVKDIGR